MDAVGLVGVRVGPDSELAVARCGQSSVPRGTLGQPIRGSTSTFSGQPSRAVTR